MKINTHRIILSLFFTGIVFSSCTKEAINPVSREINVSPFDKISAGDDHEIAITQASAFSIIVRGDVEDLDDLRAVVTNRYLKIDYAVYRNNRKRVHLYITMPALRVIDFGGAAYGSIAGFNTVDTVKISLRGDADFRVSANEKLFDINVSGTSSLSISGTTQKLAADASGQGTIDGYGLLNSGNTLVWTSGQAVAKVWGGIQLTADASGQSKIFYRGNPPQKTLTTSGQATIMQQ